MDHKDNMVKGRTLLSSLTKYKRTRIFKCSAHASKIIQNLQTFYEQEGFFDLTLVADIDKIKLPAHRIVLAASSVYFLTMFSSNFKEATAAEVTIKNIDGVTLKTLLGFMYTGSIELRCDTVEDIIKAADFFQMHTLIEACCGFMAERLDDSNCLGIAAFAEQHNYTRLNQFATSFALLNYEIVSNGNEFLQLSEDLFCRLIASEDLYVQSELMVLESIHFWIEYDKKNRSKTISKFLSLVRFTSLEPKDIKDLAKSSTGHEIREICSSWLEWHLFPQKRKLSPLRNTKPRKNTNGTLAFLSGKRSNYLTLQTYDIDTNTWSYETIPQLNVSKMHYKISFFNQKLIITGGDIGPLRKTNTVECFNFLTNKWTNLSPMGSARSGHEAAVIDGYLYVVGGRGGSDDGCGSKAYAEKYDFSTNRWEYLEPRQFRFAGAYAKILCGHLYAFQLDSHDLFHFDPTAYGYVENNPEPMRITGFGCAQVCGTLYIAGGYGYDNSSCITSQIKSYNPEYDDWDTEVSMNKKRCFPHCTEYFDRLIVAGGFDLDVCVSLDSVEVYVPERHEWTMLAELLPHTSSYISDLLFTL